MDKVRVYCDAFGKTLTVWLGDPETEVTCEEADDDTVFMKDVAGHIIGFEKLNVTLLAESAGLTVEVINAPDRTHREASTARRPASRMSDCRFCGGPLRRRRIEHMHEWGGQRVLIRKPDGHVSIAVFQMKSRAA